MKRKSANMAQTVLGLDECEEEKMICVLKMSNQKEKVI